MLRGFIHLAILSLLVIPVWAEEPADRDARLTSTAGAVSLKTTENPVHGVDVNVQVPLAAGDIIRTGTDGRAEIVVDAETIFSLLPDSDFQVESLVPRDTRVALLRGAILVKVKPLEKEQQLAVDLPTAVVSVRGTEFGVGLEFGQSHVGVFDEGQVSVTASKGDSTVMLTANQEILVYPSGLMRQPHPLTFFKASKGQIVLLRQRTQYWQQNWKPISASERKHFRHQLSLIKPAPRPALKSESALQQNKTPRRERARSKRRK